MIVAASVHEQEHQDSAINFTAAHLDQLISQTIVRHLPVIDDGKPVGIVSIGDLVKSIISDREFTIEQLEHYIHGTCR